MYKQGVLTVDYSVRKIVMPENIFVVGVADDELSEVLVFSLDRYYDGRDFSEIPVYVDYINALGEKYYDDVSDSVEVSDDDQITIKWRISRKATKSAGVIFIALRFEETEGVGENAKVTFSWKTTPVKTRIANKLIL